MTTKKILLGLAKVAIVAVLGALPQALDDTTLNHEGKTLLGSVVAAVVLFLKSPIDIDGDGKPDV